MRKLTNSERKLAKEQLKRRSEKAQKLKGENRKTAERVVENIRSLKEKKEKTPLAVSKLWVPYCEYWDGFGKSGSPRKTACGRKMVHVNNETYHCPHCDITEQRTSQRQAILKLSKIPNLIAGLISGGNRAGKTEVGAMLAVAFANGSKEPFVREWIELNDLPLDFFPEDPSPVWISNLSFNDAIEYLRPKIEKFAPEGTKYWNWTAKEQATATFPNGGKITSKSADQGPDKYQGSAVSFILLDEEHPESVFDECLLRLIDLKGILVTTMTPLKGLTWAFETFIEKPEKGFFTYSIWSLDNPFVSSFRLRRAVAKMSPEEQDSRLKGLFTSKKGLIYPEFDVNIHWIPAFDIPKDWVKGRSIDFGVRNPFVCLYFAHDPKADDVYHIYREYIAEGLSSYKNGIELNKIMRRYDEEYRFTVADPENTDGRITLAEECEISTYPAPKHLGVIEGINWMKDRLAIDDDGKPHIFIHDCCTFTKNEFRLYKWKVSKIRQEDKPEKKNDHAMDAMRYYEMFWKRYLLSQ